MVNKLANFNFEIRYSPGKLNVDADTLSRMPVSFQGYMKNCSEVVNENVLNAVSSSIHETNAVKTTFLSSFTPLPEVVQEERADIPTMPRD